MAEIISRNKKGSRKPMPRVDLTPMVDLGFLLITFFIITTSMIQPNAMKYNVPIDGDATTSAESKTLTLVLSNHNKIFYYHGNDSLNVHSTTFINVRGIIAEKQTQVEKAFGDESETMILIKPTTLSRYKNIVDALDEMIINNVKRYMVVKANNFEEKLK